MNSRKTEILAPVGNLEMLQAAIHNGASSIYAGVPDFNARGRSKKFSIDELKEIIETAHLYGIKVYLAFNILIFENELENAFSLFRDLCALSPDAFIVQDVGLARIMRSSGDAPLHGSTQMTVAGEEDIYFYGDIGFKRFTLSRELSFDEISDIRKKTDIELEAFIHGSLCISYSGQCMTSSGFGGRSANRGECAQSCRHPYELYVDGKHFSAPGPFLVSPQDLNGFEFYGRLKDLQMDALKIEGRLKSPQYVAAACRLYSDRASDPDETRLTFERGFYSGWLTGFDSKKLVDESFNSHTGIEIGKIRGVENRDLIVEYAGNININIGDGIYIIGENFECGSLIQNIEFEEDGFSWIGTRKELYSVENAETESGDRENAELREKNYKFVRIFPGKNFPIHSIKPGMRIFLSMSVSTGSRLSKSYTERSEKKKLPVFMKFFGASGKLPRLEIRDEEGHSAVIEGEKPLESSRNNSCSVKDLEEELGALGGTAYSLEKLEADMEAELFVPNKVLKLLRRQAAEKIDVARKEKNPIALSSKAPIEILRELREYDRKKWTDTKNEEVPVKFKLHVLIRNPEHSEILLNLPEACVDTVYLEFEYGRFYDDSIIKLRDAGYRIGISLSRVMKTGEEKQIDALLLKKPDALLIRNAGSLNYLLKNGCEREFELIGDFSLNITNSIAAGYYLGRGLSRITSSYDLIDGFSKNTDIERLLPLIENIPDASLEAVISYYLPSFYMEYCPYAHHLGGGGDFRSCGYPCKNHEIYLKDRMQKHHPVLTDQNCRNIMYNGQRKDLSGHIDILKKSGIRHYRIEALREASDLENTILKIRQNLDM